MTQPASNPRSRPLAAYFAGGAVLISALILPVLCWTSSEVQFTLGPWLSGSSRERSWSQIDPPLKTFGASGNLAVRFDRFDPHNIEHVNSAASWSNRGAYMLYPRRIFVAGQGTIVSNGKQIIEGRFDPSVQWLQENGVEFVLTFAPGEGSQFWVTPFKVPPAGSTR